MKELGVWEPYEVKVQTLKTAIEAAAMLLRIDDIVSGIQKKSKQQMQPQTQTDDGENVRASSHVLPQDLTPHHLKPHAFLQCPTCQHQRHCFWICAVRALTCASCGHTSQVDSEAMLQE